ncbi:hypothetical protein AG1IA_09932 [Rhizoctonia solani AG-1 IA]|uniref:Uncharacterized protein n=1 Tax=Thanatephorus cucumeris (strain AG1-IA) TaxID=983506 RepID=L8WGY1_THACA|nr:hypothetical protein AG1IA_09932 [Rhizoctonia solani AG-1 IA]
MLGVIRSPESKHILPNSDFSDTIVSLIPLIQRIHSAKPSNSFHASPTEADEKNSPESANESDRQKVSRTCSFPEPPPNPSNPPNPQINPINHALHQPPSPSSTRKCASAEHCSGPLFSQGREHGGGTSERSKKTSEHSYKSCRCTIILIRCRYLSPLSLSTCNFGGVNFDDAFWVTRICQFGTRTFGPHVAHDRGRHIPEIAVLDFQGWDSGQYRSERV